MPGLWPRFCGGAIALTVVGAGAATNHYQGAPYLLQLSGACDYKRDLNGLVYEWRGTSANGAPWYKARGKEEYIYYDPDCAGGGDGQPRWILDSSLPLPHKVTDLDHDRACHYHARTNFGDGSKPPFTHTWKMFCGNGWVDQFLTFLMITTTSTSSTTTVSTTSTHTSTTQTTSSTTLTTTTRTSTTRTSTSTTLTGTSTSTTVTGTSTTRTATTTTGTETTTTATSTTATSTSSTRTSSTRTTSTSTYTGSTSVTSTTTVTTLTTTTTLPWIMLWGACEFKEFLNGMRFEEQGATASGAPFYKAATSNEYLYYDLDCNGDGEGIARWILDEHRPNTTRLYDLDGDGSCNYHARLDSEEPLLPPSSANWRMFCKEGWTTLRLTWTQEANASDPAAPTAHPHEELGDALQVTGACEEKAYLEGLVFRREGQTASGAPFYKAVELEQYMYYDPACGSEGNESTARWIIDANAPNTTREKDLDGDGACDYHARTDSSDTSKPPATARWHMYCGGEWKDVQLTLKSVAPLNNTSHAGSGSAQQMLTSAAAPGRSWLSPALFFLGLAGLSLR